MSAPVSSTIHGLPRIGPARELKPALEGYWAGERGEAELQRTARELRAAGWELARAAGIDLVPSNDFSLYDHVLDTIELVGAVPARFAATTPGLERYFELARGRHVPAMDLTKWFDSNYHHIVPELDERTAFALAASTPFDHFAEAAALGLVTKPVLLGPVSFLLLAKAGEDARAGFAPLSLLDALLDVYALALERLGALGAPWVQLDEPCFAQERSGAELDALAHACERLAGVASRPRICVCTYFDRAGAALDVLAGAPIDGIGLDLVRGAGDLAWLRSHEGVGNKALFAGVVDGRNVWANDLEASLALLAELRTLCGELVVSTASSLLHVPYAIEPEHKLDPRLRAWLAFAREKVHEVAALARGLVDGPDAIAAELERSRRVLADRRGSPLTRRAAVRERLARVPADGARRAGPYEARRAAQDARLRLPPLPTTTIGSFPQTPELRQARAARQRGELDERGYEERMRAEIERVVRLQERLGLDVLVHGEPERADMVQYFAEQIEGFAVTEHGWVQSYGSRCVRPPIIYGDIERPRPMTVAWTAHAQSLTSRPVKGMLTGPVTMLQWSFVRDDQPRELTCKQLALAVADELEDLQHAGVPIVQVDEPAFREGLPLRGEARAEYLRWAVESFRIATAPARAETQVQTHMCYAEFGEMLEQIDALDADVLLIEAARSRMGLLRDLADGRYPRQVGPGVWDVHSPRVPPAAEMAQLLARALDALAPEQLWVCPDCGFKTRTYEQVEGALVEMVAAAADIRARLGPGDGEPELAGARVAAGRSGASLA